MALKEIAKIYDDSENCMIIQHDDHFNSRIIRIQTRFSEHTKRIGVINLHEKWLFVKRVRSEHLHKKSNSYGLNHHILANATKFDHVKITDDFGTYLIPLQTVLDEGKFLHFKKQGFERQLFLDLDLIRKYKI